MFDGKDCETWIAITPAMARPRRKSSVCERPKGVTPLSVRPAANRACPCITPAPWSRVSLALAMVKHRDAAGQTEAEAFLYLNQRLKPEPDKRDWWCRGGSGCSCEQGAAQPCAQ